MPTLCSLRPAKPLWRVIAVASRVRNTALLTALLSLSSLQAPATPTASVIPATPIGSLTEEWLRLCRKPNQLEFRRYIENYAAPDILKRFFVDKIAADYVEFCTAHGALVPVEALTSNERRLELKVHAERSGAWINLERGVNESGKLNDAHSRATLPPEDRLPTELNDAQLALALKNDVERLARSGVFSGIVSIARGSQVIASVSAGFSNRERRTPVTGESQFTLGSMGKLFTAVAVGQLADAGRLTLHDPVGKFFPTYANPTVREQVNLDLLLSHTAGLGDFLGKRTPKMMNEGVQRATEFLPLFEKDALQFAPGSSWSYSNSGLVLAGAIIEVVSRESYPDYIRGHIFVPTKMKDSDPNNTPHALPNLVTPYTRNDKGAWIEAEHDMGSPAGGAISSRNDLVLFADALMNAKLMKASTLDSFAKRHENSPSVFPYGLAFEVGEVYGQKSFGHGGGFPGVSTLLRMFQDGHYSVIVLSNQDMGSEYSGEIASALVAERIKRRQ